MNHQTPSSDLTKTAERRRFLATAGLSFVGASLWSARHLPFQGLGEPAIASEPLMELRDPRIRVESGGKKPVYLPVAEAKDPVALSLADNLFWIDIMEEHSLFLYLLMPGDALGAERQRALRFRQAFARQLRRLHQVNFTKDNYRAINRASLDLVRVLREFKLHLLERQSKGKIHTLVYPLFFTHTAREAERFMKRLSEYNDGTVTYDIKEVAEFWSLTMGEHAQFVAHLLDPQETELIERANAAAKLFLVDLKANPGSDYGMLMTAGEQIIDFKTAAEKGIATGQIKSIINPLLADHVRREAVKYVDELRRTKT